MESALGLAFAKGKSIFMPVKVSSAGWKSIGRHPASIAGKPEENKVPSLHFLWNAVVLRRKSLKLGFKRI